MNCRGFDPTDSLPHPSRRDRGNLLHHHFESGCESAGRRRLDCHTNFGLTSQRRPERADHTACRIPGVEEIRLDDDRWPRLAIVTRQGHQNDVAPLHAVQPSMSARFPSRNLSISESGAWRNRKRAGLRIRFLTRGSRVSGTQICNGRSPRTRRRSRYSCILRGAVLLMLTSRSLGNMLPSGDRVCKASARAAFWSSDRGNQERGSPRAASGGSATAFPPRA